jgi:branched-chain amino acid transport system permease protein
MTSSCSPSGRSFCSRCGDCWKSHAFGTLIRAATENRTLASALGVNARTLFTLVFALGSCLAGLAGALQLPREPANLGMDLAVIAEAFVVTVAGGLGSIPGAFVAALLIGLIKALCIALGTVDLGGFEIDFPKLTLVAEFVVMAVVLVVKPYGLMGAAPSMPPTTPLAEFRTLVVPPGRRAAVGALALLALAAVLAVDRRRIPVDPRDGHSRVHAVRREPAARDGHRRHGVVRACRLLRSRRVRRRTGGEARRPMEAALLLSPLAAVAGALAIGWFCVRLSGVYMAMLTLAFAQIVWSIAFQWDDVTGGSNGIVGVWPAAWLSDKEAYYWFALALIAAALAALAWIAHAPLGYSLRACRDSPLRAAAIGIDVRGTQRTDVRARRRLRGA